MIAKTPSPTAIVLFLSLALTARPARAAAAADDLEGLLREAFFTEVAMCDAAGAAALYRSLLGRPELPLRLSALAHLRLGICLLERQEPAAAEREFRTVVERFPGETDAARVAGRYLGEARRDPAAFMPPDLVVYTEIVEPGQQAAFLSDLIRGTPFENPLDYYLLRLPASGAAAGPPPGRSDPHLNQLRAFLNLNLLKELHKVEGIAFGATSLSPERPGWLIVFLPGSSELSRVVMKAVLPAAMEPAPPETVEGMRIFKLKQDPLHLAVSDREEVVLLGSSREMVEQAILREARRTPDGTGPAAAGSLAELEDFRRAQAARAGSLLFAYADREKLVESLRAKMRDSDLAAFDEARRLLGLDHLRAVGATLARAGDDLRITLRARVDPERHPLWGIVRTPPLGGAGLRFVPQDALAFFTTQFVDGEERWSRLRAALAPLVAGLPENEGGRDVRSLFQLLDEGLSTDSGRDLLRQLKGASVVVPPKLQWPPQLSFYLVLEFLDGDRSAVHLEKLLGAFARKILRLDSPPEWIEEARADLPGIRLRAAEPAAGLKILYAREGGLFILSPNTRVVREAASLAPPSGRTPPSRSLVPPLASKALVLRPRAIRSLAGPAKYSDPVDALVGHLPHAVFFTEEASDGLAIELRLPGATEAIRETLKDLPEEVESPKSGEVEGPKPKAGKDG